MLPDEILDLFESRLESLGDQIKDLTIEDWGVCCHVILPELYSSIPSFKTTKAMPGSRAKYMALYRRARAGQSLFKKGDFTV